MHDHTQRLLDSAKVYRIDVDYTVEELVQATVDVVAANKVSPCYIRPIILRGYGTVGVDPAGSPTDVYIVNYDWGKYLGGEGDEGVDVCVSSWSRLAPNTMPTMAKAGANYMNSQLIKMEAVANGYSEGIALDVNGYVSEGSGENVFRRTQGPHLHAAAGATACCRASRATPCCTLLRTLGIPDASSR